MAISSVLALIRKVKLMIDTDREAITITGVQRLRALALVPITTGSSGNIHGANTVKTPEKKAKTKTCKINSIPF